MMPCMGLLRTSRKLARRFAPTLAESFFSASESTIYALASGGVRCALAVIRVSGIASSDVVKRISKTEKLPEPRKAIYRKFYDPTSKDHIVLDHGILLWFPGPKSYTGEDSCELHVHGGPAVISGVMRAIGSISGCRIAEPGEFTKRAFLNGKMDLTEVDGLSDLISAETEMQRMQALQQMDGSLGKLYESWRNRIAKCLANVEAFIDFGEDENIEADILQTVQGDISELQAEIRCHLSDKRKGERLRNGVHVAIIGKPNVGKSSLLNILCKREAAIVSQIPGTTRDVIETALNFHGYPVVFADTAGIRSIPGDVIEAEGMRRSVTQAMRSDLIILMIDSTQIQEVNFHKNLGNMEAFILEELQKMLESEGGDKVNDIIAEMKGKILLVINKIDFIIDSYSSSSAVESITPICSVSCKTRLGIDDFLETLGQRVISLCANPKSEAVYLTQERYRSHLQNCLTHLTLYLESETQDLALKAHNLRNAMNCIGNITGHFGTEDILDIIFRDFCIGK